jgi:hypothetical protein
MKYRELLPNEIEAYNIGYKNGSRQAVIKVLEYETPEEKMFYRQGYNAGCQDRKRHNVKTCEIGSNVSNVSNVKSYESGVSCESYDSAIANNNTITNTIVDSKESIGGVGGKREKANETSVFHVDCQNFDEIPADILPVMKKYWTDEKIEKIRQDLAFMPSHETCVATLLTKYDSDLLKQEPKPKVTRFVKPTVEEVKAYCEERNNGVDPNDFVNHYDSKGWMIGKSPMKDWKAAVRTWESRNRKPTCSTNVNFAELVMLWNAMAERLNLDKVDESDLMPERKAEIEKIIAIKKPKDLKTMFAQLEKIISDSPKLRGWHDFLGADGHWITKQLNWKANFAFCFSTKGWCDIMGGKYNGDIE